MIPSSPLNASSGESLIPYSWTASGAFASGSWMMASIPGRAQLGQDIGHLAVPEVVAVLLEGEPEDADARALHRDVRVDEQLHEALYCAATPCCW